ncbi:cystatin-1-like [Thamnophis elegans]|uniref:cystatin-1-like n=1 Tax=Thamnophis elegans TaxID=35005 RepID=UPI0013767E28|nr:cystatin-1-like [Thamnophis elegans]
MVRSRLPVPSLLGLFSALLMLSPELLGYFSDTPVTDPEVQVFLAVAVEQYNQDRSDSANYYKVLSLMKAQYKVGASMELHLKVDFVKTTCEKRAGRLPYRKIQECEELPGNQEIRTCTFKVKNRPKKNGMFTMDKFCS